MTRSFATVAPDDDADITPAPAPDLAAAIAELESLYDQFFQSAALLLDSNPRALPYSQRALLPVVLAARAHVAALIREGTP